MFKDLILIILGIVVCYAYFYWQEYRRNKKDKLKDWKPYE